MDIRNKELEGKKMFDRRLRMLETVSKSPMTPLQQQVSTVAISG